MEMIRVVSNRITLINLIMTDYPLLQLNQDKTILQVIASEDRAIYFSEMRIDVTHGDLDLIQEGIIKELALRQLAFVDTHAFKNSVNALGQIFFNPKVVGKSIRIYLQRVLDEYKASVNFHFRLRIQMTVFLYSNGKIDRNFNVAIQTADDLICLPWLSCGVEFQSSYFPEFIKGIARVSPYHYVSDNPSFYFPFYIPQVYEYKQISKEGKWETLRIEPLFTREDVIEHNERFCDELMIPSVIREYRSITKNYEPEDIVSNDFMIEQFEELKRNVREYSIIQHDRIIELANDEQSVVPHTSFSVIVHGPNLENKNNRFMVFEYVMLETQNAQFAVRAMTISSSAPLKTEILNSPNVVPIRKDVKPISH